MPILLAYNITTESPPPKSPSRTLQYPVTPVPSPPRLLSPSPPPPPPSPPPPPASSEAVPIPLPCGRRITHAPTEDILDAETRFNTEFNTRRSAATTSPAGGAPAVSSKARKGRRVGFKRELVTFIPPPCWDLVLYGQRFGDDDGGDDDGSTGKRMGRWWWWTEWVLALVLAAVLAVGLVECGWWGIARAAPMVLGHGISGRTYI